MRPQLYKRPPQSRNQPSVEENAAFDHTQNAQNRQDRKMEWEGIVGRATYDGDLAPFWKFLKIGEFTHVGHDATFGPVIA
jgi:hypothetical protein